MKKIIAILAVVTGLGFVAPTESSARDYCHNDRRVVSYLPCGRPVYSVYQIYGRDHCGRPLGQWVTQHVNHSACGTCNPRPVCPPSYHGSHHRRPSFPVPPHHRAASFIFSFGR